MNLFNAASFLTKICVFCSVVTFLSVSLAAISHQDVIAQQVRLLNEDPSNKEARFALAEVYLDLAGQKEKEYTDKAIKEIEYLIQAHGKEPLYLALLGAARTIQARDAIFYKKMDFLEEGEQLLNEAVRQSPDDLQVILLRAITAYKLPRIFGKRKVAKQDFETIIERLNSPESVIAAEFSKVVYFYTGCFLLDQKKPDSLAMLEKANHISSDNFYIQDRLDKKLQKARKLFAN